MNRIVFQSAPPRGRRLDLCGSYGRQLRFNPRLRVGGDAAASCAARPPGVSIRASAWEATQLGESTRPIEVVSIRASAWEATPYPSPSRRETPCFNPRLRVGGDLGRLPSMFVRDVSIRASAWEATSWGVNPGPSR